MKAVAFQLIGPDLKRFELPGVEWIGVLREAAMDLPWAWEKVVNFGSLREYDCFLVWMQEQIAGGISEEVETPPDQHSEPGDRWFRHVPTGTCWRLVPDDNPLGPAFWPANDDELDPPLTEDVGGKSRGTWPPINWR